MFDAVRNNKRIVQIFLGLIILPFAFWGVDSYFNSGSAGQDLASVDDTKITTMQFDQEMRKQQDRLRRERGSAFNPEMLNTPSVRLEILNSLIDERMLLLEASKSRLQTNDVVLRDAIGNNPVLQEDGKFSMSRYESMLRALGMSEMQYEASLRQDKTMEQLLNAVGISAFVSTTQAETLLRWQSEERQFSEFKIAAAPYAEKIEIEPDTVQKYYDNNKNRFAVPEQIKAEYIVFSAEALMPQMKVSEAEIKSWYDAHPENYSMPEERRASHILIPFDGDDDREKAKDVAKTKAEEVLKEVQKDPNKFADLAKQYSKDPGSAENGGDLGFFAASAMVKPFSDAAFALGEGEVSGLVESEFGYHIIKVTGIKKARQRSLEEVHAEIEGELKRQEAMKKFAEEAEAFNNMVYEQSDSLQLVAEKFQLKIEQSDFLPKTSDPQVLGTFGVLANEKVLNALFSDDAIKNKQNTNAIEIAPNTLLAARVTEYEAATTKPFDTVKADIEKFLKAQEAQTQAMAAGQKHLDELNKGEEDKLAWAEQKNVSRMQAGHLQLPPTVLQAIFKANVQKLPAYIGVNVGDDYALYKITQISQPEEVDEQQLEMLRNEYAAITARENLSAYLSDLRSRYKIDINKALLEGKDSQ